MTLGRWLELATAGLPPEVAGRVQAEYVAHVSESGLPEAEAIAALGQPEAVRRALGRTYLSAERLEILRDAAAPGEKLPLFAALGFSALWAGWTLSDALVDGLPLPVLDLLPPALTWLLVGLTWALTRRLPAERRRLWRVSGYLWAMQVMFWANRVLELRRGEDLGLPWFVPLFGLLLLAWLGHIVLEDRRLHRTLALKEGKA